MLKIKKPQSHNFKIVPLPSEKIPEKGVKRSDILTDGEKTYKVIDWYKYEKEDFFPTGLMLLASGVLLTGEEVYKVYDESSFILFIIVEELKDE